jgi:hypothetical protein
MFRDFDLLTADQKAQIRAVYGDKDDLDLRRFAYWVKKDGTMSRKKGQHQMTKAEGEKLDAFLREDPSTFAKTSFPNYILGNFTTSQK